MDFVLRVINFLLIDFTWLPSPWGKVVGITASNLEASDPNSDSSWLAHLLASSWWHVLLGLIFATVTLSTFFPP